MTNSERAYMEIMEDLIESSKKFVVIQGIGDVVDRGGWMGFKEGQKDFYWTIIGNPDLIDKEIFEAELDQDLAEGEYEFSAIFQHFRHEGPYLEHISMKFIQTFAERERDQKLNDLLFPDDLFGIAD
jgi:hypothetical protein